MPLLSIVIPVYEAESCLRELYRRLSASLEGISADFEVIMVDDCSGDNSWSLIEEIACADPRFRGLKFTRNFGQHYGITAGLDICCGEWVVVMDCDLQDQPEEIPRLYAKAQEGYDVVLARRGRRADKVAKRLSSWLFYRLFSWLADTDYDGNAGNFRIISRNVVETFRGMRERLRFFGGLVHWMGFPTTAIDVVHTDSYHGRTTYTLGKLWRLAIDTIIAHSDKPLRLSIRFGFFISLISFSAGMYIVYRAWFHGALMAGWPSLIVSVFFIGGVIISILGIIGIYLGKTFEEVKGRPLYIVSRRTYPDSSKGQLK